jgi:cadmium resistance protein CadD (predicted permease)
VTSTWAALVAVGVVFGTSLDLVAALVQAIETAGASRRRRIVEGAMVGRLSLVLAALFVALALVDVPLAVVGLLGIVPIVFAILAIRRHRASGLAVRGWVSALVVTLTTGGDDVAASLVVLRWQVGHSVWPVVVVLFAGALAIPGLISLASRRAPGTASVLAAAAAPAQLVVGIGLLVGSAVLTWRG